MSKSDTPLKHIDTESAKNQLGEPSLAGDKQINGFDTETADGDIFAIGMYLGGGRDEYVEYCRERALTEAEVLKFLTYGPLRDSLNFWYNLNFDANSVLKFLPESKLRQLKIHNRVEWESPNGKEYTFTYIPKKVLKIQDGNNNTYTHYDISQFTYSGGLEDASADWLDGEDGKADENIDVEQFGLLTGPLQDADRYADGTRPVNAYIADRFDDIQHYLKEDCRLTRDIAREVVHTAEHKVSPPIPMGKPYSTGYIAADYVRNRNEHGLKYEPHAIQEPFWKAYRGGRFEVIKRGAVGDVAGPDINSAYPAVYAELPNPGTLDWRLYQPNGPGTDPAELDLETVRDADYGTVKVTVTTDADRPVQPFAVNNETHNSRVEYPALDGVTLWVLKETFTFALDNGFLTEWELEGAALGYENENTEYPFDWAADVYDQRKTFGDNGDDKKATLLKIVLNSLYGKTCQTQLKQKALADIDELPGLNHLDPEDVNLTPEGDTELPDSYTPTVDQNGEMYVEYQESGSMFNPFIATYITGKTRLKLLKGVVENDLEDATVMLATDCLMFEKEAFEGTDLHAQAEDDSGTYAEQLGGWDYDYVGDGFVVGSGIYQVDRYDKDETKHGLRGFKDFGGTEYDSLRDAFSQHPDGIPLESTRPLTYGDILHLNKSLQSIGRFVDSARTLNPDVDTKRQWPETVNGTGLLNGCQDSAPKLYDGTEWSG